MFNAYSVEDVYDLIKKYVKKAQLDAYKAKVNILSTYLGMVMCRICINVDFVKNLFITVLIIY